MKCAMTLKVKKNYPQIGPFHFLVKKLKNKNKETNLPRHHTTRTLLCEFAVWYVSSYKVLASAEHSLK